MGFLGPWRGGASGRYEWANRLVDGVWTPDPLSLGFLRDVDPSPGADRSWVQVEMVIGLGDGTRWAARRVVVEGVDVVHRTLTPTVEAALLREARDGGHDVSWSPILRTPRALAGDEIDSAAAAIGELIELGLTNWATGWPPRAIQEIVEVDGELRARLVPLHGSAAEFRALDPDRYTKYPVMQVQPDDFARRMRTRQRRRWITSETLQEIADVYLSAKDPRRPTVAVKDHFQVSAAQASRYVRQARDAGLIPSNTHSES